MASSSSALQTSGTYNQIEHQTPQKTSSPNAIHNNSTTSATSFQQQQQSPRNSSNISSGSGGGGGGSGGTYVNLGVIEVSKSLQDGEKFVKWDEDSGSGTPVTMRVDIKGFYLCWVDQNNEMDILDIASIRDVRTGQYAKKPKDTKLRQIVTLGSQDTLEEKTVTVCYGTDFVNVSFINFCATRKDIALHWTDELLKMAYSLYQINGSCATFLHKSYIKLCLQVDKSGKIPVKNIIKQFAANKDDRRRVEKALDISGLPSGKGDTLPQTKFQFEDYFNLYKNLTQRAEVEKIFDEIVGTSKRRQMSTTQLVDFLNKTQRDPRLNEILYPYANPARAKEIICQYEPNKFNAQKGQLSLDGFLRYLMSDDNPIMAPTKLDICDDMDQPLAHYFINSSHNTYLTGHQLTGKSSVEIYRQSLLAGCRCVELDFWNGRTEEPVIVHGYTFVPDLFAKDVLEAIAESAFKTSEFPVILSFENHCNPRQQAKIANYCRDIFGDMLLDKPLESHPLEANSELPPPSSLRRKIIIKNKKKHHHHHHHHHHKKGSISTSTPNTSLLNSSNSAANSSQQQIPEDDILNTSPLITGNGEVHQHAPPLQQIRQSSKESTGSSDTDTSSDDEMASTGPVSVQTGTIIQPDKVAQAKETEAGAEISALVNYVQPVHFSSFENAEKKNRCYEMSSFDEKQATTLLKERPIEFVNYNKHQLSRVYPAGTRFDSSNFMPQLFWNAGCQLVALNYQTLDLAMQLNLGIFEYNQRCGYLLKPEFMRRKDRRLDPFAESTVDGIIAGTVSISVLSGQFLSDKKVGTYVEVDMFGLPADTVRKKFRTRIVRDNGINPVYDDEPFVFKKVVLPELASLRIAAYEEGGKFIGHRVLPVIGLCPGYRHVMLRNECGQPLGLATLFLCIVVKDFVPDGLSDFAEALANPIKYQSELEKRSEQLSVLTEDMEPTDEDGSNSCLKKDIRCLDTISGSPKHRSSINVASTASIMTSQSTSLAATSGTSMSMDVMNDSDLDASIGNSSIGGIGSTNIGMGNVSGASGIYLGGSGSAGSGIGSTGVGGCIISHFIQPQCSLDHQTSIDGGSSNSNTTSNSNPTNRIMSDLTQNTEIIAEPLEAILEHKLVKEKRLEMEKKLDTLRKKHDKEKLRATAHKSGDLSDGIRKSKFYMNNKLVKRLSSKNMDVNAPIPACSLDLGNNELTSDCDTTSSGGGAVGGGGGSGDKTTTINRTQSERLLSVCRDYTISYQEIQEKYHEIIYCTADKVLRNSQANQLKQLKTLLEKETGEVMRHLNVMRRTEVKALAEKHRDRDELVRMKREVASSLVERGVSERVRLANVYEKKRDELQRQHDIVKNYLMEHKNKAKSILEKESETRTCISSDGFLILFHTSNYPSSTSNVTTSISSSTTTTTTLTSSTTLSSIKSPTQATTVNNNNSTTENNMSGKHLQQKSTEIQSTLNNNSAEATS